LNKRNIIQKIIHNKHSPIKESSKAWAPSNIALVKYWGKRNIELNLPKTSSLSVSLGHLGTETEIRLDKKDVVFLNEKDVTEQKFAARLLAFIDLFRPTTKNCFCIGTINNFPTAAGFASSASGFAAIVKALNDFYGWQLNNKNLSVLARMGSGSAARSIENGFVEWYQGDRDDGLDSYAEKLENDWPELRIGVITITAARKKTGSTEGMLRTVETSPLYNEWPQKVEQDLVLLKEAIQEKDFDLLGKTAENNALNMHATMIGAWPPMLYWLPETVAVFHKVWQLRQDGLSVYFTIDAGPNVKLLFPKKQTTEIKKLFNNIEIIKPFEHY
jgi:diphosphomevalonate decarboxylase